VLEVEQLTGGRDEHADSVEAELPVAPCLRAGFREPTARESPHLSALRPPDRLQEVGGASPADSGTRDERLYFAEDERPGLACDDVDLAGPRAVVALDHLVSEALEPPDRKLFATTSDLASPIRRHDPRLGEGVCPVVR
jgi:hypothetical protein